MPDEIVISTGARLHFGFLSCKPTSGREFGGAGLMIDSPGFEIAVRKSDRFSVVDVLPDQGATAGLSSSASAISRHRVKQFAYEYCQNSSTNREPPAVEITIRSEIPSHIGLGSGTQLGMAVAKALSLMSGQTELPLTELASRVSRGARSAIGIHGFAHGGFLVGAGKLPNDGIGTLTAREEFPSEWRMLLITPETYSGPAGADERDAFDRLPAMQKSTTERLSSIVLTLMLPAVTEAEFNLFGEALFEFGATVGEYFAPVQGGLYSCESMTTLVKHLRAEGIRGVAQTSWGPTIIALCQNENEANHIAANLKADDRWSRCRFHIAATKNCGAEVRHHDR